MADNKKMQEEAEKRLNALKLHKNVMNDFKRGKLNYSENTRLGGILYWLNNEPEWEETVKKIEQDNNVIVYHVAHETFVLMGDVVEFLTCLCV